MAERRRDRLALKVRGRALGELAERVGWREEGHRA